MSLILKQEDSANAPVPPIGKGTIYLNADDALALKDASGNITTFLTIQSSNTQLLFNQADAIVGNANLTWDNSNALLSVSGNVAASGVKTDNLYYANGSPWDLQQPAGSNSQIQFNSSNNFGANPNLFFDTSTETLSTPIVSANTIAGTLTTNAQPNITSVGTLSSLGVTGNASANNLSIGNLTNMSGNLTVDANIFANYAIAANGNVTGANLITGGLLTVTGNANVGNIGAAAGVFTTVEGTLTTAAQPNITSVGTLSSLIVTGNASAGNLSTGGNVNSSIVVNGGTGIYLAPGPSGYINFFTTGGDKASVSDTGNIIASNLIANSTVFAVTANISGNVNAGNVYANSGTIGASLLTGTLTTAAQPNVTSLGTLSSVTASGNIQTSANIVTDLIVGRTSGVTITATGANQSINLVPTGTGTVNVGTFRISNVATPTQTADAATKQYVDNLAASGIHYHEPVFVESPNSAGNLNATYNNGTSGVGATLTNAGTQVALTIDGVLMTIGKRVLIYNQTNQFENGVYTVTTVGTASTNWVLTRATDADTYSTFSPNSLGQGDAFFVTNGNTGAGETYICNTVGTITFGTTAITFAQISDSTLYTAGTGLSLTGTEFSISNTAVTTGTYGGADVVSTIAVNQQGQITSASNTVIQANAANLSGTTLKSTVVNSSLTSVGTLGTLTVSGNANVGNIGATTGVFTTVAGSLTTASQSNITSVGTLGSLAVTANITAGNVYANSGTGGFTTLTASGNVSGANVTATTYNITGVTVNITAAGSTQGTATALTKAFNVISTVSAGQGVVLPTAVAGMRITVVNTSATTVNIYPASGAAINAQTTNAPFSLPSVGRVDIIATSTTQWYVMGAIYV